MSRTREPFSLPRACAVPARAHDYPVHARRELWDPAASIEKGDWMHFSQICFFFLHVTGSGPIRCLHVSQMLASRYARNTRRGAGSIVEDREEQTGCDFYDFALLLLRTIKF